MACRAFSVTLFTAALVLVGAARTALAAPPPDVSSGQWIWPQAERTANQSASFRQTFDLPRPAEIVAARLRVLSDFARTTVHLNGRPIGEVDDYAPPGEFDLLPHLLAGGNGLLIHSVSSDGPAAVAVELELLAHDGVRRRIVSDRRWLATLGARWEGAAFDSKDAIWAPAVELGATALERWAVAPGVAISELDDYTQWKQALGANPVSDPATFLAPPGFRVELLRSAEPNEGSWISLAFDPRGRLIVAKETQGLLRMTPPAAEGGAMQVETIEDSLKEIRGILSAHGSLFVNANMSKGLYRLRDTDGDDRYDEVKLLYASSGGAGHGRNDLALGPDGLIYSIHGDSVDLPTGAADRTSPYREQRRGAVTREGHVVRLDRDGKRLEILLGGLRNPFGIDFNGDGQMFTYDADAEHDMGAPWYRPTRVNHLTSGADYGWRGVTGSWPPYFPDHADNGPPTLDIGKGSPTAVKFGTASRFPPDFQKALFVLDWAYGRIVAVHMTPRGASYACRAEPFVQGRPLNVTDLEFGPDGAMYFVTGGRATRSGLYRVRYVGPSTTEPEPTRQQTARAEHARQALALKNSLEAWHGRQDARAIDQAWPHLASADPVIRHAARIAIEHQPTAGWQERAWAEERPDAALELLSSLARGGDMPARRRVVARLNQWPIASWTVRRQQAALDVYRHCLDAFQGASPELASATLEQLDALAVSDARAVHESASRLLASLDSPRTLERVLPRLVAARTSTERLHSLFVLSQTRVGWHAAQLPAFAVALAEARSFQGGEGMPKFLKRIEADWLAALPEPLRPDAAKLLAEPAASGERGPEPVNARSLVREWKFDELASLVGDDSPRTSKPESRRGEPLFGMLCARCHRVGRHGAAVGPDLTAASRRYSRRDLLEAIVAPSKVIAEQYRDVRIETHDGRMIVGRIVPSTDFRSPSLRIATNLLEPDRTVEIPKSQIETHSVSDLSPMPLGLLNVLTAAEIVDLLAYVESGGDF